MNLVQSMAVLACLASTALHSGRVAGQQFELEARVAIGSFGMGSDLGSMPTLVVGMAASRPGPLVLAASLDLFVAPLLGVTDEGRGTVYNGEVVAISGRSYPAGTPRAAAHLGSAFGVGGWTAKTSVGLGAVVTSTDFGSAGRRYSLQPWYGLAIGLGPRDGLGIQLEIGRHKVPSRYYREGFLLRDFEVSQRMVRLGVAIPLRRDSSSNLR